MSDFFIELDSLDRLDIVASYPLEKWNNSKFEEAEGIVEAFYGECTGGGTGFGFRDIEYSIPVKKYAEVVAALKSIGFTRVEEVD
jgi:hypothetical protein